MTSCPISKSERDIAASKKNCEQLAAKALCRTSKKTYLYHCVINGFRNQTLEVCAPRRIIFGHCTEYNVAGGVIQRQATAKCNSTFPKCANSYYSTEAYKFPDCYELVYIKQDSKTMTVQTEESTTTSRPDETKKNNPFMYVVIVAVVVICVLVFIIVILCKRHRRSTLNDEECHGLLEKKQDTSIKYFNIKAKHFQHFRYVINLAKDCELRLEKVIKSENRKKCVSDKDVMIKIGIVGDLTDDNLNLLSKGKEEKNMQGERHENNLGAVPLLSFQKSALKKLRKKNACYKILIQSEESFDKTNKTDDSIIIVGQNKQQIKEVITTCLEKQLDEMLQDWLEKLKHEGLKKETSEILAEIEAIRKQLILDNSNNTAAPDAPCFDKKAIVPVKVKDYLLGRSDVNSFGIWGCSTFKIFVNKGIDNRISESELINMDQNFFEKYHLKIESKYMVEKQTMRHYGSTSLKYNLGETFQNLSTKPYDGTKEKGNNITFTDDSRKSRSIGHCLYITRGFNAFEIKKFVVDIWKGTCNRYCQQKTNIFVSI